MILLYMLQVLLKDACLPGSSECSKNMLRVCDINGFWIQTDCPKDTECSVKANSVGCVPVTEESEKGTSKRKKPHVSVVDQLLKSSNNTDLLDKLKKEINDPEDEEDEVEADDKSSKDSSKRNVKKKTLSKLTSLIMKKLKHKKEESDEDEEPQGKPKKANKNLEEEDSDSNQKKESEEEETEKKKTTKKPKTKGKAKKQRVVKTVTYEKRKVANDKEDHTVTVTRTIIKKDKIDGIDVELSMNKENGLSNAVGQQAFNNTHKPPIRNINYNVVQPSAPAPKNNEHSNSGGGSHNGSNSAAPKNGGSSGVSSNGSGSSGGTSNGNGSAASKNNASPNGGGISGGSSGASSKPTASGNSSQGVSAQKPSGGDSKPAAGGSSSQGGSGSPGGGSSKPAAGGSAKPSGGGSAKPSGGDSAKPSGSDSKQAASGESKQAAGNSSSQGGGSQKPSDGDSKQAAGTSGGSKSSSGGGGGGAVNITVDQVTEAMSKSNYQPKPEFVEAIVKVTNEEFKTIEEAAMFLAQTGHESGGFQYIEEIDCAGSTKCAGQYGGSEGAPGKSYHGRGFIQLSWPANYKEAGEALGMGDELFQNPEKVAEDPELGAKVSVWFWQKKVATAPGVSDNQFGATTKAINGALECTGSNLEKSKNRYKIYKDLAEILNISKLADEGGCY